MVTEVLIRVRGEDGAVTEYRMDDAHGDLTVEAGWAEGAPDARGYRTFERDRSGDHWSLSFTGTGLPSRAVAESA